MQWMLLTVCEEMRKHVGLRIFRAVLIWDYVGTWIIYELF